MTFCLCLILIGCSAKVQEPPQQNINYFTVEHLAPKSETGKSVDLSKVKLPNGADNLKLQADAIVFGKKLGTNLHAKKLYPEHSLASITHATADGSWQFTFSVSPENTVSSDKSVLYIVLSSKGEITDAWETES